MSSLATLYRDDVAIGTYRWHRGEWRRWSGRRWAKPSFALHPERVKDPRPFDSYPELPQDKRDRLLEIAVDTEVLGGGTVVHRSSRGVTMAYPGRVNHAGHLLLTIVTFGVWGVVWIAMILARGEHRVRYDVDPWGTIWPVAAP
jgi:hypothetical protein